MTAKINNQDWIDPDAKESAYTETQYPIPLLHGKVLRK